MGVRPSFQKRQNEQAGKAPARERRTSASSAVPRRAPSQGPAGADPDIAGDHSSVATPLEDVSVGGLRGNRALARLATGAIGPLLMEFRLPVSWSPCPAARRPQKGVRRSGERWGAAGRWWGRHRESWHSPRSLGHDRSGFLRVQQGLCRTANFMIKRCGTSVRLQEDHPAVRRCR